MEDYGDTKAGAPKGAPGAGEDAAARITALEAELAKAREEARQHQERWLRERAELENLKKRAARERAETMKFANESLLRDLLPIVDNLERAVAHAESAEHEPNSVIEEHQPGYRLQERLLRPALVSVAKAPDPNLARDKDRD